MLRAPQEVAYRRMRGRREVVSNLADPPQSRVGMAGWDDRLGAERGSVEGLVLRQGLAVVGVGLVIGIAGAWGLSGLIESLLFEVDAPDPTTFVIVSSLLAAVAAAACWIPARRATSVDPVTVLREE